MIDSNTQELKGRALNHAVAVAMGTTHHHLDYAGKWQHSGPLIVELGIGVKPHVITNGRITSWSAGTGWPKDVSKWVTGDTLLEAAMRWVVFTKCGSQVKIPKELM